MFAAPNIFLTGKAVAPSDPYFYDVSLLLTGDGTNGAQNNTFLDSSTNNFTITRNGNATQGTFSPYGNLWSNYFDAYTSYFTVSAQTALSFSTGDFTIEAFVYIQSMSTYVSMIDTRPGATGDAWVFGVYDVSGGKRVDFFYGGGSRLSSNSTVPLNQWNHIAVTRSGSTIRLFINGVLDSATVSYSSAINATATTQRIGALLDGSSSNFTGYISNLRVVKGTALYTSTFTPSATPLTTVSGTSLLTCQSNRFIDNSSNNFTLTVSGTPSAQRFSPFNPTAPYDAATIGGSGYFDGSGDCLTAPSDSAFAFGTGDFTVEGWFYQTADKTYPSALEIGNHLNTSGILFITKYAGTACIYSGAFYGGAATTLNQWNHIAWVRQSGSLKIYVNGVLGSTTAFTNNLTAFSTVTIGSESTVNASYTFPGYMSNLRAVKGTAVYTSNFAPPTAPLTAITNTSLLCNFTNAGIPDAAMMNDLETVGNAQVSTSVKKYGTGSLYFDGTGDYLKMVQSPTAVQGTEDFTIEAWIYPTSTSTYQGIVELAYDATGGLFFGIASGSLAVYGINGGTLILSGGTITLNTWQFVSLTKNAGVYKLWLNGTNTATATNTTSITLNNAVSIGAGYNGGYPFTGYIDDLRITKGYARYTSNFTPPTAALPTY